MKARIVILVLDGFLAVTAAWGALLVVPQLPASLLRYGPFHDFTVPAIALGLLAALAGVGAIAVFWRAPLAAFASMIAGVAIVVFELVEASVVGSLLNAPPGMDVHGYVALWLQPFYAIIGVAIFAVAFFGIYRPWQLRWGATSEELARSIPGDEIVHSPIFNATRGVTISAPPQDIWPWIAQIGFWRAGWYTYDLLDNAGRRSAERIVPELQHVAVGDLVPLGPGKNSGMRVKEVVPNRFMVWWSGKDEGTTWVWTLDPMPDGKTRLVTRVRASVSWSEPLSILWLVMFELADFPMMRKCLLGIKRRAETLAAGRSILEAAAR